MILSWRDSKVRKLSRRARAGLMARLIRVSRALLAMARDCKGATRLEAAESASSIRSNLSSIFSRFFSTAAEAWRSLLRSLQAS